MQPLCPGNRVAPHPCHEGGMWAGGACVCGASCDRSGVPLGGPVAVAVAACSSCCLLCLGLLLVAVSTAGWARVGAVWRAVYWCEVVEVVGAASCHVDDVVALVCFLVSAEPAPTAVGGHHLCFEGCPVARCWSSMPSHCRASCLSWWVWVAAASGRSWAHADP